MAKFNVNLQQSFNRDCSIILFILPLILDSEICGEEKATKFNTESINKCLNRSCPTEPFSDKIMSMVNYAKQDCNPNETYKCICDKFVGLCLLKILPIICVKTETAFTKNIKKDSLAILLQEVIDLVSESEDITSVYIKSFGRKTFDRLLQDTLASLDSNLKFYIGDDIVDNILVSEFNETTDEFQ